MTERCSIYLEINTFVTESFEAQHIYSPALSRQLRLASHQTLQRRFRMAVGILFQSLVWCGVLSAVCRLSVTIPIVRREYPERGPRGKQPIVRAE